MLLRQSTDDQQIALGPLVQWDDDTEALVPYTGTVANTDIRVLKSGAESEVSKSSGGATHTAGGLFLATFNASDTDTLGPISIRIGITGVEPFVLRATVVPAAVYDALVAGDPIHADVRLINGNAATPASDVAKESSVQEVLEAVEGIEGGGAGGVVLVPLLGQIQSRTEGTTIRVFTRETTTLTMAVVNAIGDAVDLSETTLRLVFERRGGGDLIVLEDEQITKAESSIAFAVPTEVSQAEGSHAWALRDGDGTVLMQGPLIVEYAPEVDT